MEPIENRQIKNYQARVQQFRADRNLIKWLRDFKIKHRLRSIEGSIDYLIRFYQKYHQPKQSEIKTP